MLVSAVAFSILIGIVILFQLALAAGAPWGSYAMGGKFPGKYSPVMRIASIVQAAILSLMALIVLSKTNVILPYWHSFAGAASWFVVVFSGIALMLITSIFAAAG
ncbi:hypothetical protein Q5741_15135 [Paenibacillus sp. JX-17]|uniref:Uncharacterized protein n=1 Tax=Paenibacillus lacisoli TaxID=3064525 RepID=A0ABT9CEP2_9BACL|nr:hypothetical protein [Paenibacillus sp. JX-17]MDO7907744.1 hypothetical protein [Paenibacillus sp. JX-17]